MPKTNTKTQLARDLGISRSMLYYQPKQPGIDEVVKSEIKTVLAANPSYGHKRIALALECNKKRILRVMKKFDIKPYKRRVKRLRKKADEGKPSAPFLNLIEHICPIRPNIIWVSDFTPISFHQRLIYLSTILDLFTREILGWHILTRHPKELVLEALEQALSKTNKLPEIIHSDQGSEYDSQAWANLIQSQGIKVSMSRKASPWENGYQESFYSQFKVDLGNPNQYETLGELVEAIHQTIFYYNYKRIHTKLKMSPKQFREQFYLKVKSQSIAQVV